MNELQQRIANLSPAKQQLLKLRLQEQGIPLEYKQPIPKRIKSETYPLSSAQRRLWFLHQLEPEVSVYNMPKAMQIHGNLHLDALRQALETLIARHETLRTNIKVVEGTPVAVIAPNWSFELPVVDLRKKPTENREAELQRLLDQEIRRPFHLERDLMLRGMVFHIHPTEYILLLVTHHIASDYWSTGILYRELGILYESCLHGQPPSLPDLPIQYADLASWQQEWLQSDAIEAQLVYWQHQLGGDLPILELPTDRPRPAAQTYTGARQSIILPAKLMDSLERFGRREHATLFMTLLAAFQTLLSRYTGQGDIIVGAPIAGRNQVETEKLIGCFLNILALRTDLSDNPTFQELLGRIRTTTLNAYAHQDLPFEYLLEKIRIQRHISHTPVFQVMLDFLNVPENALNFPDLRVTRLDVHNGAAMFDLLLYIRKDEQGMKTSLVYNTDLFEATTITRMLEHYQTLLEGIVVNPTRRISALPMLTEVERQQILVDWNDTQAAYPHNTCLHQLFEAQVERTPDSVAVMFGDQHLTYRELNTRANQLAHYLQALGVGPEVLVGVWMERSLEMLIGLLGILKAGGAYVPLDPAYPQERVAFMLEDAQMNVLLMQEKLLRARGNWDLSTCQVVCLDPAWDKLSQECEENPASNVTAANLAYVIYTSGSTGMPKGVAIEHHSSVALLWWGKRVYSQAELAGVLASTSICFDLAMYEIFLPLVTGGRVILAYNALQLPELEASKKVTLINTVPSAIDELLRRHEIPSMVRTVNLAGEPLSPDLVDALYDIPTIQKVYDLYGPSEDTTYSTWSLRQKGGPKTIGRPVSNTQIYIVDDHVQPVPIGVPGEIYIGGAGLARGYLNRPDLTAERFRPNPFSPEPDARLYKTGDVARYLPDGNIEFLGRRDHQVKLRGFRIELGEIETVLSHHPAVRETVVVVREDQPGEQRLVAYVVEAQDLEHKANETPLRDYLKQKLPEYMIPSAFVMLSALPLTPNGKIDRRALPAPDTNRPDLEEAFVPPRDQVEHQLTQIWEQLLARRPIGVRDNFFDLGGHSLLAGKLLFEIEHALNVKLPMITIFQEPTIERLAEAIRRKQVHTPFFSLIPIQPQGTLPPLFFIYPLGAAALDDSVQGTHGLALHLGKNQPFYGLRYGMAVTQDPFRLPSLPGKMEELAAHYIHEIQQIQPDGPYFLCGRSAGGLVAFEMACRLHQQGQTVALLVLLDTVLFSQRKPEPRALKTRLRNSLIVKWFSEHDGLIPRIKIALFHYRKYSQEKLTLWGHLRAIYDYRGFLTYQGRRKRHLSQYVPNVYPGKVTLFESKEQTREARSGWKPFVSGELEIIKVPGRHAEMMNDASNLTGMAEALQKCLTQARQNLAMEQVPPAKESAVE